MAGRVRARFNLLLLDEGEYLLEEYAAVLFAFVPAIGGATEDEPFSYVLSFPCRERNSNPHCFTHLHCPPSLPTHQPRSFAEKWRGRVRVCTRGVFFEPEDARAPLLKLPFRTMPGKPVQLPSWVVAGASGKASEGAGRAFNRALAADGGVPREAVLMQAASVVEIKANNAVGPYRVRELDPSSSSTGSSGGAGGGAGKGGKGKADGAHALGRHTYALLPQHLTGAGIVPLLQQLWTLQQACASQPLVYERVSLEPIVAPRRDGAFNLSLLSDYREKPLLPAAPLAISVDRVFPLVDCPGRLMLTERALYFQPSSLNNVAGSDPVVKWPIRVLRRVMRRRRMLREVGLELFLRDGAAGGGGGGGGGATEVAAAGLRADCPAAPSVFLAFQSPADRNLVYSRLVASLREYASRSKDGSVLTAMTVGGSSGGGGGGGEIGSGGGGGGDSSDGRMSIGMSPVVISAGAGLGGGAGPDGSAPGTASGEYDDDYGDPSPERLVIMTRLWQMKKVSNLEYLEYLNLVAGRTYADLTQYPVVPWVIADYVSRKLDLASPATFRDLSKPVGALNAERLASLRERYAEMPRGGDAEPPFLYGAHYSTPGYCLFYLLRSMPEHMLRLQSGRFDNPDRLFFDVASTWAGVVSMNMDVKELLPEFYKSDGNFLLLPEGLDLGVRHNGRRVGDVTLPPWAYDVGDFVQQCREALESDFVSARLHTWIDLTFGYKQRGREAEAADNVFYYLTYEGAVDMETITDPARISALQQQIAEFGQTPRQLFTVPHASRTGPLLPLPVSMAPTLAPARKSVISAMPPGGLAAAAAAASSRNLHALRPVLEDGGARARGRDDGVGEGEGDDGDGDGDDGGGGGRAGGRGGGGGGRRDRRGSCRAGAPRPPAHRRSDGAGGVAKR